MRTWKLAVLASVLMHGVVTAQDSVSSAGGMPGDAVDSYDTAEVINTYVIDLVPALSDWGNPFNIGPVAKASRDDPLFFNNFVGSSCISAVLQRGAPFFSPSYSRWTAPGQGINASDNSNPSQTLTPSGQSLQFCLALTEGGVDYGGVVGAIVNFRASRPDRLYVTRINAASNGVMTGQDTASIALGQVDSCGNIHLRADDFGTTGPIGIFGNNVFRVNMMKRSAGTLNVINNVGAADTGDWIVFKEGSTYNTPSAVPAGVGPGPSYIGTNFDGDYAYETYNTNYKLTQDHLGGSSDHRGNVSYSRIRRTVQGPTRGQSFLGKGSTETTSLGTAAMLVKDPFGDTKSISLWNLGPNGEPNNAFNITFPATITDNDDGTSWPELGDAVDESIYYRSQTPFQGGNGPIAVGRDPTTGLVLVATPVTSDVLPGDSTNPIGAMAVARFNPLNPAATLEWTLASWTMYANGNLNNTPTGKALKDGPGGATIGKMIGLVTVTGGSTIGPSLSAPCFDAAGNLWFLAAAEMDKGPFTDTDTILVRSVYNPATFSYQLEKVLEVGDVFRGKNSRRDYQIRFISIADSNSVSSSTMWSGNIIQAAQNDMNPGSLSGIGDPRALGGLIFNCSIVYDRDNDGDFDTPFADPLSLDEQYSVMMAVMPPNN